MKKTLWLVWVTISIAIAIYYLTKIFLFEDKSQLLIGESTYGHYQIEMSCSSCHTNPFGGDEMLQNACLNCHDKELKDAFDSHPKKKFTDPRNADFIDILDARYCISCHTEHQREQTHSMGLTLPEDYCFHCHTDIGEERESHKDLPFDSCASAGCHNYHDNRALYEAFLIKNSDQPWLREVAKIATRNHAKKNATPNQPNFKISDLGKSKLNATIEEEWNNKSEKNIHKEAGVSCINCHRDNTRPMESKVWIDKPSHIQCQTCHSKETEGFTSGKHGMRLANIHEETLTTSITPAESHLEFNKNVLNLQHSCNSCHTAHTFNTKHAAVESCLNCHSDEHSLAFKNSPHAELWNKEKTGKIDDGAGVSCATCHMPRIEKKEKSTTTVHVEHNQNLNLRPNEKMIRPVCMQCHSLAFSIDALADDNLIKNNFNGKPKTHIESINWAKKREKQ